MNSNTQNPTSNNSCFYTPVTPASTHLILHQLSSIHNPTTADFERLIRQYQQYFFYIIEQERNLQLKTSNKNINSFILTQIRLYSKIFLTTVRYT